MASTESPDEGIPSAMTTRDLTRLALLCAVALILFVFEAAAPRPLPWLKLGLGNVAVLMALLLYDFRGAFAVTAIKILVGSLVTGAFAGPSFVLASGAGLASLLLMAGGRRMASNRLSAVGLSILGAGAHQVTQLLLASIYLGHPGLLGLFPLFVVSGIVSGGLTGVVAHFAVQRLRVGTT